ncbi:Cupin [Halobacillus dabanensis]|uniref:Cupin n=1 Tax=Halobacillus dabanensis TaxID=240302 RepID=A0A1I3UY87_HALDA|nr:cupin domain-containing protein [Halobacillus dabanensis]SFJ87056.1 Cupin [Halobacillus dabanensis]
MTKYMDYTSPSAQFAFDMNKSTIVKKNDQNLINVLGVNQLNTLENSSLLDIHLSKGNYVEPHYHQNASELVYMISGALNVSMLNPFTKEISSYTITPGQVANVPHGWWHYEEALVDDTHFLAIFDAPTPEVILGSDLIKLTPPKVMAETYSMNENKWKEAIQPVKPGTLIGPVNHSSRQHPSPPTYYPYHAYHYQPYPYFY